MNIRINRKSELSYMLKRTLSPESFTGECIWTRGQSWNTHTLVHTPMELTPAYAERGKEGHVPQNISLRQKNLSPNATWKRQKGKTTGSSFSLVSVFLNKTFTKRIHQSMKWTIYHARAPIFFSGKCDWFHPKKSIDTIQILKQGILKHHDNRWKGFDKIHHQFIMKK